MSQRAMRKTLSAPGLLEQVRACFQRIKATTVSRGLSLTDCLLSGLAVLGLKYPSLLQLDQGRHDALVCANLQALYGIRSHSLGHGPARAFG